MADTNPDNYVFFLGTDTPFSQWHPCPQGITVINQPHDLTPVIDYTPLLTAIGAELTFPTAEHWMMTHKALLFLDYPAAVDAYRAASQKAAKMVGRRVKNFDQTLWDEWSFKIVVNGNYSKFSRDANLRAHLLATGDKTIVEAANYDRIWGIGYKADRALTTSKQYPTVEAKIASWGQNKLGKALMEVRDLLRAEQ